MLQIQQSLTVVAGASAGLTRWQALAGASCAVRPRNGKLEPQLESQSLSRTAVSQTSGKQTGAWQRAEEG